MSTTAIVRPDVTLEDRYTATSGPILISGIQALVRLLFEQRRLDSARGHNTGIFISGYEGSPLGGLDLELKRAAKYTDPAGIVFRPGLNEELAATAVGGTQLLSELEGRLKEAVTGFWYGKSPGLDRAADAIRHANLRGTAPLGGAVALIGDDPASKSSTVPSSCEPMCRSLVMPVLAPGTVAEMITLGLHAVQLSRHSGLWAAMKIVADVADGSATIDVAAATEQVPDLPVRPAQRPPVLLPPTNLDAEQDQMTARLARVYEYDRLVGLNRIVFEPTTPRFAVVSAGMGYQALLRALDRLGFDEQACEDAGLRIVQLQMPWPLDPVRIRELLADVETVLVVEDKLAFVETQLKEALYRQPHQPLVIGKYDADGRPLLSVRSTLGADDVADGLLAVLPPELRSDKARAWGALRDAERAVTASSGLSGGAGPEPTPKRIPTFCSGCPHNTSTKADADQLVGVGIGCHTMVALDQPGRRGKLLGMPQMGGEGAQWFGLSHFTSEPHMFQNIGDGTFHHSGSLAVRAAVAAGVNITYRLLYNNAVAMTGGQTPVGVLTIPQITRLMALEGVTKIVVATPEPDTYDGVMLDPIARVRHRDDLDEIRHELESTPGVTLLIYDDRCATEKRRMRKRDKLETPPERVWINERVCEGCGDCGEQSTCVSVLPVPTPFGRKTRIQQSSCNLDMTCVKGDCPSFLLVTPKGGKRRHEVPEPPAGIASPTHRHPERVLIRMPGVGGTGVVTISSILQMAAHLQGLHASALEQTGLAQKGGPVISDLRITKEPVIGQIRASRGGVDVLLGFDLLGAASPDTLATLDPNETVAVLNTGIQATAAMVTDPTVPAPNVERLVAKVRAATRADLELALDAEGICEQLFDDHMPANMLLVGAAYQHGLIPLEAEAIERAIELNGAAVALNKAAFRWGRAAVAAPEALETALRSSAPAPAPGHRPTPAVAHSIVGAVTVPAAVRAELIRFVPELVAYQDAVYARRYVADVQRIVTIEQQRTGGEHTPVAIAYARGLYKLMAYKDEYEVARLHLDQIEQARIAAEFGAGAKVQVMLHPPLLRAMGMNRKLKLERSAKPLFTVLHHTRKLRGTRLDPFGYAHMRRLERELIGEYRALVLGAVERLTPANTGLQIALAESPDMIRGYEQIKAANVGRWRARTSELLEQIESGEGVPVGAPPEVVAAAGNAVAGERHSPLHVLHVD